MKERGRAAAGRRSIVSVVSGSGVQGGVVVRFEEGGGCGGSFVILLEDEFEEFLRGEDAGLANAKVVGVGGELVEFWSVFWGLYLVGRRFILILGLFEDV